MVTLGEVHASNALISSTFPPGLVAVFVGATSGIGEITLKTFAKYSRQPRVYFVGRSQDAADRIAAECKQLNPQGEFNFIKADVSLIRVVDEVCESIKAKEKHINILFLSAGVASMDRSTTSEGLHLLSATAYYSRMRFMTNLIPHIRTAPYLRRVVTVAGGGREGPIDATDFQGLQVPLRKIRAHLCTLTTLGLETVAKTAPEVSFVHDYPGTVKTSLLDHGSGFMLLLVKCYIGLLGHWVCLPIEECGERQLFLATSERFPPLEDTGEVLNLVDSASVVVGSIGEAGSGVYSVGWDCESASLSVLKLLANLRAQGMVELVRKHTQEEFQQITGSSSKILAG